MDRIIAFRMSVVTLLCLGAIALGSAVHLPAVAAESYGRFISPMVSATCSSTSPCLKETNSNTGAGIEGVSTSGHGSIGLTKFKSTSTANGKAGVLGQDLSTSGGFDSGVLGTSTIGTGVQGKSVSGNGVEALSTGQSALFAESTYADGVQSVGLNNDGTNSSTQNNSSINSGRSGVWGHDDSTDGGQLNVGVAGSSTNGTGVSASSTKYIGLNVFGGNYNGNDVPALSMVDDGMGDFIALACSSPSDNPCGFFSASRVFALSQGGDITIAGTISTSGVCKSGCIAGRGGAAHRVTSYAETQTIPSIDDFGEAQLVNGQANVRLGADFANVVDQRANYLVFITPEGDNKGLYVTQKTHAGFLVKECQGGHSTLAFSYRIVAKPFGMNRPRLPMESIGQARAVSRPR